MCTYDTNEYRPCTTTVRYWNFLDFQFLLRRQDDTEQEWIMNFIGLALSTVGLKAPSMRGWPNYAHDGDAEPSRSRSRSDQDSQRLVKAK